MDAGAAVVASADLAGGFDLDHQLGVVLRASGRPFQA
jgi:hypothetical protein